MGDGEKERRGEERRRQGRVGERRNFEGVEEERKKGKK